MATHHHAPVSQVSLRPHSPSPSGNRSCNRHNTATACASSANERKHPLYYSNNDPRTSDMYLHSSSAVNEASKQIDASFNPATYSADAAPMPNEAEINAMSVAELRQAMLSIVRFRRPTSSPTPTSSSAADAPSGVRLCSPMSPHTFSPTFSTSSSYASVSSLGTATATATGAIRRTSVQAQFAQAGSAQQQGGDDSSLANIPETGPQLRKRVRHDPEVSAAQRMGIDLLLNASTLTDRSSDHSVKPSQADVDESSSFQMMEFSPVLSEKDGWRDTYRFPRLPPISQLENSQRIEQQHGMSPSSPSSRFSGQPMSAPTDSPFTMGSIGASSLKAYKLSSAPSKAPGVTHHSLSGSYSQSFPPPLSTTRSQPGIYQHPSPPSSLNSSPNGVLSTEISSRSGLSHIPSLDVTAMPPAGDTIICTDISRHRQYPISPTTPLARPSQSIYIHQQAQQQQQQKSPHEKSSTGFSFHHSPVLHHGPPTSPRNLFLHAQGYFSHHALQHSVPPPPPQSIHPQHSLPIQQTPTLPPGSHMPQQQSHSQPMVAFVETSVVRNVSKPKFNYAFMDTKRPRGPSSRWSAEEDELLKRAVKQFGEDRQWVKVAQQVPGRSNLQCRQRWLCNIKAQVEKERNTATLTAVPGSIVQ
ncbi:myb-like DNA-binding protein bas1 [Coemansia spiralis]|uniref:Myb-like DNA-binding protein bas1 n=2 Tax=Coemansia TaxID=4863 RepID=A0A9W8G7R5_9FUNG|nr:myb-like DNA-binding protein bas1 [Coemansia umbellata]KAJ2624407.1 myb-like DNA-binding protein bas1 [Coemansia sp. RSA 1358]KAJ2677531.1 myb-like DNA-binding protein bas1 [Coemansia spiralis]